MSAKNLCKRCALSGTAVCPPGYMRNSVSTSEGVMSCSGFVPKPVVPRREDAKPPDFSGWAHASLNLREKMMQHERDQARAERDAVAAGVQDLHDRLIRVREKACRLQNELTTLKEKHTELCVKHANAGTTINAQEACAKRQDDRILSLQNRVNFLERGSYREAIEELGDLVFNGEPDYDPAEVVRAVRELYDALRHFRGESPPQRSDALLLRKLNRIQAERDTARQQRDLAIRDREKSRHRLQRVSERHANCFALLQEAKAERSAAWENRNRFCAVLNEIGDILLGTRDSHAPDAVVHAMRKLCGERNALREELDRLKSQALKYAPFQRTEARRMNAWMRWPYEEAGLKTKQK